MPWYWRIEYQLMRLWRWLNRRFSGYRLWRWLDDQLPAQCGWCGRWVQGRRLVWRRHRAAGYIPLCPACRADLYGEEG